MDKRVKSKWLKALRSRKYKQTTGRLRRDGNERCCLGVLADVQKMKWKLDEEDVYRIEFEDWLLDAEMFYGTAAGGLEFEVAKQLATMNDGGKKFYQIARWIERNL